MTDSSRGPGADGDRASGVRRWMKVLGLVIAVAVLLVVVVMLVGGGGHGPSRHNQPVNTESSGQTLPAGVHAPPGGQG